MPNERLFVPMTGAPYKLIKNTADNGLVMYGNTTNNGLVMYGID